MPNKNYNRGRAFEYKVRDYWRGLGYEVFRTAGSHSKADLIALHPRPFATILIQCKTSKGLMTKAERKEFKQYCEYLGSGCVVAYRTGREFFQDFLGRDSSPKEKIS
jgi:Holliday junction resolvase